MKTFKAVAVGGTFDQLHRGHKALLDKAFEVGGKVLIGLTIDNFVASLGKRHRTASYDDRLRELELYLSMQGWTKRAQIIPLQDSYGPTIYRTDLDAIVVSEETEKIAQSINYIRKKAGYNPLQVIVVCMIPAENKKPISTTRIRNGEIDRNGHILQRII